MCGLPLWVIMITIWYYGEPSGRGPASLAEDRTRD
jgi:hypothetical protein